MTLRNRHDRANDHDGVLDASDVDIDEIRLPDYPARMPLLDVLDGLAARLSSRTSITLSAVIRRTMEWQIVDTAIRLDAVIGTASPLTYPGFFTMAAVKIGSPSGTRTVNAVIKRNQTGSFTADAVIV